MSVMGVWAVAFILVYGVLDRCVLHGDGVDLLDIASVIAGVGVVLVVWLSGCQLY